MKRRSTWLLLVVLAGGAIGCAGKSAATVGGGGSGGGVPIPVRPCSNGTCPTGSACLANQCIPEVTNVDDLAIEIGPPSGSGSQITERPAGTVPSPLVADLEFSLTVAITSKSDENAPSTIVPANAAVVLTVPSLIPGRPNLSFQDNLTANRTATLYLPQAIRGEQATLTLIPTTPSDLTSPPYRMTFVVPMTETNLTWTLPANQLLVYGQVRDALARTKTGYQARAFQQGSLASSVGSTNSVGSFAIALPEGTSAAIALELVPENANDPWVTFNDPLSLTQPSTDLGTIGLPPYLEAHMFQVAVLSNDTTRTPVPGAMVRAYTKLGDGDKRISTKFFRDGTTNAMGGANLQLIPGDSNSARSYVLSVVPPQASLWASRCIDNVSVGWNGQTQAAPLPDVMLEPRPLISGFVVSASGAPIANLVVSATRTSASTPPCLPSPTTTTVTTNEAGYYLLPVDPGDYQLDYIPTPGSPIPRVTAQVITVASNLVLPVVMPPPALVEGDVRDVNGAALPNTTIRFFEPRCPTAVACGFAPFLRAETQSDANGHFRAVIAAPAGTY